MEIKVSVEGIQRVVCGVTEMTTCQEVVIALAQALGRTGRYTLRENFKGYVRNISPGEHLLESLGKYGQQAREVQLTLHHQGPSQVDWPNKPRVQLRRPEGGGKLCRGSAGAVFYRQSLPPLSQIHPACPLEEAKRPKRKSLTLMEEAWSWLENLGRGRKQQSTRDKRVNDNDGEKRRLDNTGAKLDNLIQGSRVLPGKDKNRTDKKKWKPREKDDTELDESIMEHKTQSNKEALVVKKPVEVSEHGATDATENLKRLIGQQQASLRGFKLKIASTEEQIFKLETQQAESMSDEEEQLAFWLNELKAEEGYEKDLQKQFLDLKDKAAECKSKLQEYKIKVHRMDLTNITSSQFQTIPDEISESDTISGSLESASAKEETVTDVPDGDSKEKMVITRVESKLPCILVTGNETGETQLSSPSELREWWSRWAEAQKSTSALTPKVVHRSEIIIHLQSTRV